jgi:uncharacterized protein YodC (DUF2158 family)
MSIEVMKQALDALVHASHCVKNDCLPEKMGHDWDEAIDSLRKAIEKSEKQKPVAWSVLDKRTGSHWYTNESKYTAQWHANEYSHRESDGSPSMVVTPLYTTTTTVCKWFGLTDEDKQEIEQKAGITEDDDGYIVSKIFNLTDAKLKEKNT